MAVSIRIHPNAFDAGGPLEGFDVRANPPFANTLSSPRVPSFNNPEGSPLAPKPGFIASASPLTHRTNINEDGTSAPAAPSATRNEAQDVRVHISPTTGSSILRGRPFQPGNVEFDLAYGIDVGIAPSSIDENLFETALLDTVGRQFMATLQDLIMRQIIEVRDQNGVVLTAQTLADFSVI